MIIQVIKTMLYYYNLPLNFYQFLDINSLIAFNETCKNNRKYTEIVKKIKYLKFKKINDESINYICHTLDLINISLKELQHLGNDIKLFFVKKIIVKNNNKSIDLIVLNDLIYSDLTHFNSESLYDFIKDKEININIKKILRII